SLPVCRSRRGAKRIRARKPRRSIRAEAEVELALVASATSVRSRARPLLGCGPFSLVPCPVAPFAVGQTRKPLRTTSPGDCVMKHRCTLLAAVLMLCTAWMLSLRAAAVGPDSDFPQFRMQEVATDLKVCYAVLLVDLNGDGKKDIVVVDTTRVVWYENPTWKRRTMLEGQTLPDNVCIDALDLDGDGQPELILGAGWRPFNTKEGGTVQWLQRGK